MKIRIFQSDKGDCLLITSNDDKRVLVDGGMSSSYKAHVAPTLKKLREDSKEIDVVYVSHIDQDHIAGILKMTDDFVAWKIFDFQTSNGNTHARKPQVVRPPAFSKVWNNAFHDQIGKNSGRIEEMLAARAQALSLIPKEFAIEAAEHYAELAQSKAEAIRLSRRLGSKQLNVPVNPEFDNGLMFVTDPAEIIDVGTLKFTIIGPFAQDLRKLRNDWNDWLRTQKAKDQLARIRRKNEEDEDGLVASELKEALGSIFAQAAEIGDRNKVTLPNLASLMFFLEEDGSTVLLTGDGHWEDIIAGLENTGRMPEGGGLHVSALKVQHHGSEHNWKHEFGQRITADNYVFCGNGAHKNPDLRVVDAVLESRLGSAAKRSKNAEVGNPFKLWFNCASSIATSKNKAHMKKIEKKIAKAESDNPGAVSGVFLDKSFFDLKL